MIEEELEALVAAGDIGVVEEDGERRYFITEQGRQRVVDLIDRNPKARAFLAKVTAQHMLDQARKKEE